MSANLDYLKTLESYMGKRCKIVYRDGGVNAPSKAFYGTLVNFDAKFQTWEGDNGPESRKKYRTCFNHDDVSRIVFQITGNSLGGAKHD